MTLIEAVFLGTVLCRYLCSSESHQAGFRWVQSYKMILLEASELLLLLLERKINFVADLRSSRLLMPFEQSNLPTPSIFFHSSCFISESKMIYSLFTAVLNKLKILAICFGFSILWRVLAWRTFRIQKDLS